MSQTIMRNFFFSNYSEARKSKDSLDYTQEIKMMCA